MNDLRPSTSKVLRQMHLEDGAGLDLYLARIQQNLTALLEQCVQLCNVYVSRQESLREIQELQQYLAADGLHHRELIDSLRKRS
jgi:hypothetical protein